MLHQTITVLDYDDTLLPSSYLKASGALTGLSSPSLTAELQAIDELVLSILRSAVQYGPVYVLSAADVPWIEATADCYLPRVASLLRKDASNCIKVISAREWYFAAHGIIGTPERWKNEAFQWLYKTENSQSKCSKTLLSIGDSDVEHHAARKVVSCVKTVKFIAAPSTQDLYEQLRTLQTVFHEIILHDGPLDLLLASDTKSPVKRRTFQPYRVDEKV